MSVIIPAFDPAAAPSGEISSGMGANCGTIVLYNDSNVDIVIKAVFTGEESILPAGIINAFRVPRGNPRIEWRQFYARPSSAVIPARVYGVAYDHAEPVPGTYPAAMVRSVDIANDIGVDMAHTLTNIDSPADTDVITLRPASDATNRFYADNNGDFVIVVKDGAGNYYTVIDVNDAPTGATAELLQLGTSGASIRSMGDLIIAGALRALGVFTVAGATTLQTTDVRGPATFQNSATFGDPVTINDSLTVASGFATNVDALTVNALLKANANVQIGNLGGGKTLTIYETMQAYEQATFYNYPPALDSTAQPAWNTLTLAGTWVNAASPTGMPPAGYYADMYGQVRLRGVVGGNTTGTTIFTLPVGARPAYRTLFPTVAAIGATLYPVELELGTGGALTVRTTGPAGTFDRVLLNGLSFRTT